MKRFMKKGILMMLVALGQLSAFAGGKVEVSGDIRNGTVEAAISGTTLILTVTPADGYYIRKADIVADPTFMPAAARAAAPIASHLTLMGDDPADLSLPRTYTLTMPEPEYDVLVQASFTARTVLTDGQLSLSETKIVYNGGVQRPVVTVAGLTEGRDYEVSWSDPQSTEADTYSLTVTGKSTYRGTLTRTYIIFRGGNAEVNSAIQHGTVQAAIDGLTLTLSVTPADGYYIRKQDIAVEKTFMPLSRGAAPVADRLIIEGDDPADLSLPRTYTVTLPGWEYDAWVDATFTQRTVLKSEQVTLSSESFVYNGSDQRPVIIVGNLSEGRDYVVTYDQTAWTNVGTYSLSVTGKSTWQGTVSRTFTITKAVPVVTPPVANTLTFNREEQPLAQPGAADGGEMLYSLAQNGNYQTSVPTAVSAGTYTVFYRVVGDSNHQDVAPKTLSVTIAPKTVSSPVIELDESTFVYDGEAKEPAVTVKDGDAVIPEEEYEVAYDQNTDAGEALVIVTDLAGGNYVVTGSTTFTIEKATPVILIAPQPLELTYTGESQTLAEEGLALGGTMVYSLAAGGPFSEDMPTAVNEGEYRLYYKVHGYENYHDLPPDSITVTIAPMPVWTDTAANEVTPGYHPSLAIEYSMKEGWNTIVLPLPIELSELGEETMAYRFKGYAAGALQFVKVTGNVLAAATPYVFYSPEERPVRLVFIGQAIESSAVGEENIRVAADGVVFQGTYTPIADMAGKYGVTDKGKIAKGKTGSTIRAFRAYFELPVTADDARLLFLDDDGETTAMSGIRLREGNEETYNLNGQRVATMQKGRIYVVGKKKRVKN